MNSRDYEYLVARHLAADGYDVQVTPATSDWGVDVFATKDGRKIAVQVKMYGDSRPINREMIMGLFGAAAYFDCDSGIIATNGRLLDTAQRVADKLGITVMHIPASDSPAEGMQASPPTGRQPTFESIWEEHVMPLAGQSLRRNDGSSNEIIRVDWAGVERVTSNGKRQFIKIEIFKLTINHLLREGFISRAQINDEYKERASSGVVLILSHTPVFEATRQPVGLRTTTASPALASPS